MSRFLRNSRFYFLIVFIFGLMACVPISGKIFKFDVEESKEVELLVGLCRSFIKLGFDSGMESSRCNATYLENTGESNSWHYLPILVFDKNPRIRLEIRYRYSDRLAIITFLEGTAKKLSNQGLDTLAGVEAVIEIHVDDYSVEDLN